MSDGLITRQELGQELNGELEKNAAHLGASLNVHGNNGNILYFADKTQIKKPLEEVFSEVRLTSEQEFYDYINNVAKSMPNQTSYKRYLTFSISIPSLPSGGANVLLKGGKANDTYQWQTIETYSTVGSLMYRNCFAGVWSEWQQIATDKPIPWINATLQNGWVGSFFYKKNAIGQLEITLSVASGVVTPLTAICELPFGYRPRYAGTCSIVETTTGAVVAGAIIINNMGRVFVSLNPPIKTGIAYTASIVLPT